eukprot:scaffold4870_cov60-Phaeocystis_antarctica.AAC.2
MPERRRKARTGADLQSKFTVTLQRSCNKTSVTKVPAVTCAQILKRTSSKSDWRLLYVTPRLHNGHVLGLNTEYITGSRTGAYRPTGFGQITLHLCGQSAAERRKITDSIQSPGQDPTKGSFRRAGRPCCCRPCRCRRCRFQGWTAGKRPLAESCGSRRRGGKQRRGGELRQELRRGRETGEARAPPHQGTRHNPRVSLAVTFRPGLVTGEGQRGRRCGDRGGGGGGKIRVGGEARRVGGGKIRGQQSWCEWHVEGAVCSLQCPVVRAPLHRPFRSGRTFESRLQLCPAGRVQQILVLVPWVSSFTGSVIGRLLGRRWESNHGRGNRGHGHAVHCLVATGVAPHWRLAATVWYKPISTRHVLE